MAVFSSPVVLASNAAAPIATCLVPVVLDIIASEPTATFDVPVVFDAKA